MTVKDLCGKHGFTVLSMPDPDREVRGAYVGDLLSWVMGRAGADQVWITIMSNVNTVAVGSLSDVSLVLLAEGVTLPPDVLETAKTRGVNVAVSPAPAFETALAVAPDVV